MHAARQQPLRHLLLGFYHALSNAALDPLRSNKNSNIVPPSWGETSYETLSNRIKTYRGTIEEFLENHASLCDLLLQVEEAVRAKHIRSSVATIRRFIALNNVVMEDITAFRKHHSKSFLHYPSIEYVVDETPTTFNPQRSLPGIAREIKRLEAKVSTLRKKDLDFCFISPHTRYSCSDDCIRSGHDASYLGRLEFVRYWLEKTSVHTTSK